MNLDMMFRSDVLYVSEKELCSKKEIYLHDYDYFGKLTYCEETDTCGPCLVCDIGDFNNLMTYKNEFKFSEHKHRFYGRAKFKIRVFPPKGALKEAEAWVIDELEHLRPFDRHWSYPDELCRNQSDYDLAIEKARKFPYPLRHLNGREIQFKQYSIDRLILEDKCRPIRSEMSRREIALHNTLGWPRRS